MKGKCYTFRAGDTVPTWMWRVSEKGMARSEVIHNRHHGKVIFGRSCIVIRGDRENHSKIMPSMNSYGDNCVIRITGYHKAEMGGIEGATGVLLAGDGCLVHGISSQRLMESD